MTRRKTTLALTVSSPFALDRYLWLMEYVNGAAAGLGGGLEVLWFRSAPPTGAYFALFIVHCVLTGSSLGLLAVITSIIWKRRTRRIATWIFYILSVLSLLMLACIGFGLLSLRFRDLKQAICEKWGGSHGIDSPEPCLASLGGNHNDLDELSLAMGRVCRVFQVILIIISDGAIIYRAVALVDNTLIKGLLTLDGISGLCFGFFIFIAEAVPGLFDKVYSFDLLYLTWVLICFSCASNVAATGAIGLTTWKYARHQIRYFGSHALRISLSLRVLATLLESGLVYCLVQAAYVGLSYKLGLSPSMDIVQALFTGVSGLYLALVFLAVNAQADNGEEHDAIAFELLQIIEDR